MTTLADPRPLEDPAYWSPIYYTCFDDFCDKVADRIEQKYGWNFSAEEVKKTQCAKQEYNFGSDHFDVAEIIYDFILTSED